MISLAAGRKVGWDGMGQDRWQGAPFLGPVGLLTGAKTTPPRQMGVAFRSSGGIRGTSKQFLGRQESEARSYCPPLAGSGQTESCIKLTASQNRASAGKFPAPGSRTAFHFDHFPTNLSLAPVKCCAGDWRRETLASSLSHGTLYDSQTTYGKLRCLNQAAGVAQWTGGSPNLLETLSGIPSATHTGRDDAGL